MILRPMILAEKHVTESHENNAPLYMYREQCKECFLLPVHRWRYYSSQRICLFQLIPKEEKTRKWMSMCVIQNRSWRVSPGSTSSQLVDNLI